MTARRGKDMLLKIGDGAVPQNFTTVGGLRTKSFSLNTRSVDITHAESAGWRELLADAAPRQASLSGQGVFLDNTAAAQMREVFFTGEIRDWQVIIPGFGRMEGSFQLVRLDYGAEHRTEVTVNLALESAGVLSFTEI